MTSIHASLYIRALYEYVKEKYERHSCAGKHNKHLCEVEMSKHKIVSRTELWGYNTKG